MAANLVGDPVREGSDTAVDPRVSIGATIAPGHELRQTEFPVGALQGERTPRVSLASERRILNRTKIIAVTKHYLSDPKPRQASVCLRSQKYDKSSKF